MQLYFNYRVSHQLELVNPATMSLHSTTCVHTYGIYCNNKAVQRTSFKQVGHRINLTIHTGLTVLTELKHGRGSARSQPVFWGYLPPVLHQSAASLLLVELWMTDEASLIQTLWMGCCFCMDWSSDTDRLRVSFKASSRHSLYKLNWLAILLFSIEHWTATARSLLSVAL